VSREAQTKRSDAEGEIEPDLAAHRDRLQLHGPVGAANQNVGAEARSTDIVTSEEARAAVSSANTAGIAGAFSSVRTVHSTQILAFISIS
jgi:hypothetical protein